MARMYARDVLARWSVGRSTKVNQCASKSCRKVKMASEKPVGDRVKECMAILNDIQSLGIPQLSPELSKLRGHMNEYIRDGTCWSGIIDFSAYGRIAEVVLPRRADKAVEVLLRVPRASR